MTAPPGRGLYCNRTLNLRRIRAIGYDMDYTLIHYDPVRWERCAYEHVRSQMLDGGWPVEHLTFKPELVIQGLVIDRELGNLVKANRFGYVKRARHGERFLDLAEQREQYGRTVVDLAEPRWVFLNTLFSLSEACLYAQLVALRDAGKLPEPLAYDALYARVKSHLDEAHMAGQVKSDIAAHPEDYVVLDPDAPRALLDQKEAGKRLLLITNSEWAYTQALMSYTYDRYLPQGMTWRELFDVVIVAARKPAFFVERAPLFEVVDDTGLLKPVVGPLTTGRPYLGGHAAQVEAGLGLDGSEILYVGDHIYSDVHVSKGLHRWRTLLVVRELEEELRALSAFAADETHLTELMARKEELEADLDQTRLALQRRKHHHPLPTAPRDATGDGETVKASWERVEELKRQLKDLDAEVAPLAMAAAQLHHERWGLLLRTGNDKSYLARQVERHADAYTSRVSNFLFATPYAYIRSPRGSLPHDPG